MTTNTQHTSIIKHWIPDPCRCSNIECYEPAGEPGGGYAYSHECDENAMCCSESCAKQFASDFTCPRCEGSGLESERMRYMNANHPDIDNCPDCNGSGWVKPKVRPTPSPSPDSARPKRDKTLIVRNAGRRVTNGFGIGRLEGSGVPITSGAWVSLEDHKKLIIEYESLESYADTLEAKLDAQKDYPHMCRIDHVKIGYSEMDATDDERCPLCQANDEIKNLEAKLAELRKDTK